MVAQECTRCDTLFVRNRWGVGLSLAVVVWGASCGRGLRPHSSAGGLEAQSSFVSFGAVLAGSSSDGIIYLRNIGSGAVTGLGASVAGSAFALKGGSFPGTGGDCSSTLAAGATCSVVVTFLPPRSGSQVGSANFSGGSREDLSVALSGAGLGGGIDSAFGSGGMAITSLATGSFDRFRAIARQADGKIVATGAKGNAAAGDFLIARFLSNGSLDTSFGTNGVRIDTLTGQEDVSQSCLIQTDGKIVSAGFSNSLDSAVVRYTSDGVLDTTFGSGGVWSADLGGGQLDRIGGAVLLSDGKILASGNMGASSRTFVIRLTTDGVLDSTFGVAGLSTLLVGSESYGDNIVVRADGKFFVAAQAVISGNYDWFVARFLTSGSVDSSFNGTGSATTSIGSSSDDLTSIAVQSDGKIVVAGFFSTVTGNAWAVGRYLTSGVIDSSFGVSGIRTIPSLSAFAQERLFAVAVQSDGKVIGAGQAAQGSLTNATVARLNSDGSSDSEFGTNGMQYLNLSTAGSVLSALTVDSAGNFLGAGYVGLGGSDYAPMVVRIFP